ncbi:DUF5063 domain-containing protein [Dysgonomonas sp. 520]|uniref:DUF5063 domain-containing protein n=1 Tax=Dysgonomonas sp. 520 TaxID=2302931 RepID=UPI0013D6B762|nr:DUF5063 domain-containing protein [Dysgonomonas sp. 520]NDW08513.1 DUF5063 domain-containing protein [Dysgonomonas sp. 520]
MESEIKNTVFSKNVVEFVVVALQYCEYLEVFEEKDASITTDQFTKLLPLLYLKASLLPETESLDEEDIEITVTEDIYNNIFSRLFALYGKDDAYLEVFLQDMKYSDTPIGASISEDLTDIYQDLKNFLTVYERGITENMNDALYICTENFKEYWGQKLVNVLRALHALKYKPYTGDDDADSELYSENEDELW